MTVHAKSASGSRRGSKKSVKSGTKPTQPRKTRKARFSSYVHRVLRTKEGNLTISSKAMAIMNSFVNDNFERLACEASRLANLNRRSTLSAREIQSATRLLLPKDLAKDAMQEGTKAIRRYSA